MFELINTVHKAEIQDFVESIKSLNTDELSNALQHIIQHVYDDIPEKNRISYGRYSVIKNLGVYLFPLCEDQNVDVLNLGTDLFSNLQSDPFLRSLGVQLASLRAEKKGELSEVLSLYEQAADDDDWIVRECCCGFIRSLVRKYPEPMHQWYIKMVKSDNALQRRFAIESLRPVVENRWLHKNREYAFSILRLMYEEPEAYPRTSVGNSLSDWMRINCDYTLEIVKALAHNGNRNSYWIAYRACRNLVKKEPVLVMDILQTDSYKYKDRVFYRKNVGTK